jgi:hypothetical protein
MGTLLRLSNQDSARPPLMTTAAWSEFADASWVLDGRVKVCEDIVFGLENAPSHRPVPQLRQVGDSTGPRIKNFPPRHQFSSFPFNSSAKS